MKRHFFKHLFYSLMALLAFTVPATADYARDMIPVTEFYQYEKARPLIEKVELLKETDLFRKYDVEYSGAWGSRVTAYLMVPKSGSGPFPCIIFGHGFTGSRDDIEFAYDGFAKSGIAVFSIDFWYHGDRKVPGTEMYSQHLTRMRDGLIGSAVDLRRGYDLLEMRQDIDGSRIGYVGGSMGGIIGALFAGSEQRIKAPVLVVGGGDWSYLISHSVVTQEVLSSKYSDMKDFSRRAREELAPADPVNMVANISPRPLLMLNAKNDVLVPPVSAKRMFLVAGEPKKLVWYSSGHEIPMDQIIPVIQDWAEKYLKNDSVPDFTSVVDAYNTTPIKIDEEKTLEPPADMVPLESLFSYNKEIPLFSDRLPGEIVVPGTESFSIRYTSTHEKSVSGHLFLPVVGEAPYACVVMVHDAGKSGDDLLPFVHILARNGIASAVINTLMMSDEKEPVRPYGTAGLESRIIQAVADTQRLMDLLDKFGEIKAGKYIVLGDGAGGIVASITASLDGRVNQLISMNAGGGFDKEPIPAEMFNRGVEGGVGRGAGIIDPARYLNKISGTPVLVVVNGRTLFSRSASEAMYAAANEPKEILWIDENNKAQTATMLKGMMRFIRDYWSDADGLSGVSGGVGWKDVNNEEATIKAREFKLMDISESNGMKNIRVQMDMRKGMLTGAENKETNHTIIANIKNGAGYIILLDDGISPDREAGDGKYTGTITVGDDGKQRIVCAGGITAEGVSIEEACLEVSPE